MTIPRVVVIDESLSNADRIKFLREALHRDTKNPRQTIQICADINLTGEEHFEIWDCTKLIAPKRFARSPRRLGPRVYRTDWPTEPRDSLFKIVGDNVLVSGFRLEGPTDHIGMGYRKEKGILISPPALGLDENEEKYALPPIRNIVISNMEIYHWSGVGVQVDDNINPDPDPRKNVIRGRLHNTRPDAVRIVGCYFHHNRHGPGEGYGVNSAGGAYVTIEQNVFDENRHAIAGGPMHKLGHDYSGYTARDNLILAGGGVHILEPSAKTAGFLTLLGGVAGGLVGFVIGGPPGAALGALIGAGLVGGLPWAGVAGLIAWQTHQIDMHGTESPKFHEQACCGIAGETIIIERNTILYDGHKTRRWMVRSGPAIKIRGNPIDKAVAKYNVFRHENEGDAIHQNGNPRWWNNKFTSLIFGPILTLVTEGITNPIEKSDNTYRCGDLTATLGHGDFFGAYDHGLEDNFMATGVTWWARSPVTYQWQYLNTMTEKLPELRVVKADNDNISDVTPSYTPPGELEKYSKSGRSPWQVLIRQ